MKFGKEYASKMVPEWQEAYMDYKSLKLLLKDILHHRQHFKIQSPVAKNHKGKLKRKVTLYRAFSGLTSKFRTNSRKDDDEVILVSVNGSDGHCQTTFLMAADEGGEKELMFFRRLDDEFNKVNDFYKNMVGKVIVEADELSKQMSALIALRIKVEKPMIHLNEADKSEWSSMHSISEDVERDSERNSSSEENGCAEGKDINNEQANGDTTNNHRYSKPNTLDLEILEHVTINVAAETPKSTLKGVLKYPNPQTPFGRQELKKSEEQLRRAFIEFHRKLRLLQSYSSLNRSAFSKIMKKYDKVTSRKASRAYLEMVENSYLGNCKEGNKLLERVEATFVKHFADGNRRNGMSVLRPRRKRERHRVTYSLGFLSGCSVALIVAICLLIHARDIFESGERNQYMENIFPLYSLFGYIVLHMTMYAANIYFWRRYGVNYPFIFGFKQGTELGYKEVLLFSSGVGVLTLAAVLSNLDMEINPETQKFQAITELVPLGLLTILFVITICPFNVIYRSSRYFLLRSAFRCLCAPLYKVILPDFFLADQLTSQVQAFRSLEFYFCYYGWGDFMRRSNKCNESDVYKTLYVIVAVIPYWSRLLQCCRRLLEEKDIKNGLNGLKYFSTIIAVVTRTIYDLNKGTALLVVASVTSAIATIYGTYWDLVIDWGLLRRDSKNPWLRDKLLISNKSVYFVAMVVNILLRLAWMQTVLGIRETPLLHNKALIALLPALRSFDVAFGTFSGRLIPVRYITTLYIAAWARNPLYRLENEHLNNVGNFRAFTSVPLPFSYDDEDKNE